MMFMFGFNAANLRSMLWLVPLFQFAPSVSVFQSSLNKSCGKTLPYSECQAHINGSSTTLLSSSMVSQVIVTVYGLGGCISIIASLNPLAFVVFAGLG